MQQSVQEGELLEAATGVRRVPHNRLTFDDAEVEAVARTVRSGHWAQGPRVAELEAKLAQTAGVQHAVCVASGLSAVRLALGALQISTGDTVLVPAYCCVALPNACLSWGATPVAIEIEPTNWNMDATACRRAISERRPKAVIAVNTFGVPADLNFGAASGIPVIEDCAHAFGLQLDGCRLGGRSDLAVLSFYATKLLGGGEGGAVLTNSGSLAEFVRSARDYADQAPNAHRLNDKMTDIEAALVLAQLERLPSMIARRAELAHRYMRLLGNSIYADRSFRLPKGDGERIWYRFAVEVVGMDLQFIVDRLRLAGVDAALAVTDWRAEKQARCAIADRAYRSLLSLPLYPSLTTEEQDHVVRAFLTVCQEVDGA